MSEWIYDFEVYKYDWFIVLKNVGTKEYIKIHNDNDAVKQFVENYEPMVGFNVKHYDSYILRGVLSDFMPEKLKEVNDFIISGNNGWDYKGFDDIKLPLQIDLMDDMQQGLSLKSIEAHLGMDIVECNVPFDIDRPLTEDEIAEVFKYCTYDVDATHVLYELRKDYLNTKADLGVEAGIDPEEAKTYTNAKLTALYLGATPITTNDERMYIYPDNLRKEYIPVAVFDFFDRLYKPDITDEELWAGSYGFNIGLCGCKVGFGGVHGAILGYYETAIGRRQIINVDVASYYPNLMIKEGYLSRAIADPKHFERTVDRRIKAKNEGIKRVANPLKLVVNGAFGAMLNKYNPLYDPKNARSVCITGQLRLIELANNVVANCPSVTVIQLNTDGLMVSIDNDDVQTFTDIINEWQARTGYILEQDNIKRIIQKDVNNYIEIAQGGKIKIKGGQLVRGIAKAGPFNINNNAVVVANAILAYFTENIKPKDYILADNDPANYQLIAKASHKYTGAFYVTDTETTEVQRCNRVFAAKDPNAGTLYKKHKETGTLAKIAGLPKRCFIHNTVPTPDIMQKIDKQWYIDLAIQYIKDFQGISRRENSKMATKENKVLNVWEKLQAVRTEFAEAEKKQSGINQHAEFTYYELSDIIPIATPLFSKYQLMFMTSFPEGKAVGKLIDLESKEDITIEFPFVFISDPAKYRMNEVQGLGASITYMRRYLYYVILDMCPQEEFDSKVPAKPVSNKPATPETREEIKKELTAPEEPITEMQTKAIKAAIKKLIEVDPSKNEFCQKLVLETKKFTTLTKKTAETTIKKLSDMVKEAEGK